MMSSIFFMMLAGIFNAGMDKMAFTFNKSIFSKFNPKYWDPSISWKNQWKQPLQPSKNHWYYFGLVKPPYEEAFPYSTYFLVFLTDGWHLFKTLMLFFIMLAVVNYKVMFGFWIDVVILYTAFTATFTAFYSYMFVRDNWKLPK